MATEKTSKPLAAVLNVMERYADVVYTGLDERWEKLKPYVRLYESETYEVIAGLLARQATLTIHLALNPGIWTGHIAPLILRAMTDAHITLAWVLKEPMERTKKYIFYGLGQEKLHIAHLEQAVKDGSEEKEQVETLIERKKAWLTSQRHDFLTEVNVGSWSGANAREMAQEADCEGLYRFAYTPFSAAVHNMWNHVSTYNLRHCTNPLHKFHRVPTIAEVPLDPDFVYRSAKYVSRSYESVDRAFSLQIGAPDPVEWLVTELNALSRRRRSERKKGVRLTKRST